ncbi:predicted protein [Paecilomyces variotii No. 5]|uniref:Calcineurin-like phosphoesterase domain-containing protein n=1 Tax=Byssochlamys spectabilis (strain No. 5 / NBRC 109023) TaxID=1356009 RepID=V5FCC3_BYSSN|nr:predicted protein [Paecilomyces variotii No. 5]
MDITNHATAGDRVKTRFLIISDTHGEELDPEVSTLEADVAIHCGDLTEESKVNEYKAATRLLSSLHAPLKLVIAGNHDFTLDTPAFKKKVAEATPPLDPALVRREYGDFEEMKQLFDEAKAAGIHFLDEGTHVFALRNGASLTVYASPYTPSLGGDWGFQYHPDQGHEFTVKKGVDVVITHGPPNGILDYTDSRKRAGCPRLFGAIARARPRLHCFGHIHEGWGAKQVAWRGQPRETPSHFTDIDHSQSVVIDSLANLQASRFDSPESVAEKSERRELLHREGCRLTSQCTGDANPLRDGRHTLFVNASIEGTEDYPMHVPWMVELELAKAG